MEYTPMYKSIPVLDIELDEATGSVQKLRTVHQIEHLPLGAVDGYGIVDRAALNTMKMCQIQIV